MSDAWLIVMLLAGGMFAGGSAMVAWARVPIWRRLPQAQFAEDFEQTLRLTDRVQPALLVVAIVAAAGFALTEGGPSGTLGGAGAAAFALVLLGSVTVLVPLQRALIEAARRGAPAGQIEDMRRRWFQGNRGRAVLAVFGYALLVAAAL